MKERTRPDDKMGFGEEGRRPFRQNIGPILEFYGDSDLCVIDSS